MTYPPAQALLNHLPHEANPRCGSVVPAAVASGLAVIHPAFSYHPHFLQVHERLGAEPPQCRLCAVMAFRLKVTRLLPLSHLNPVLRMCELAQSLEWQELSIWRQLLSTSFLHLSHNLKSPLLTQPPRPSLRWGPPGQCVLSSPQPVHWGPAAGPPESAWAHQLQAV